jgi:hypothetical protein
MTAVIGRAAFPSRVGERRLAPAGNSPQCADDFPPPARGILRKPGARSSNRPRHAHCHLTCVHGDDVTTKGLMTAVIGARHRASYSGHMSSDGARWRRR